ncbi:MAG: heme-binding protein [Gammaproteobacteria bacterium]|nr:heme-binding protein [Gammaproteobacteria bacterium]MDH5729316.1 heme-binding protein [Gammaproteobacteria bacterium]
MLRLQILILVSMASLCFSNHLFANSDKIAGLEQIHSLNLKAASNAAWAAIESCRKKGYSVAVSVVDRGGNEQVMLRDRFAGPHTPETAFRKAWTANSFRQHTGDLAEMLQAGRIPNQVQHNPGALLVGGGVFIEAAGKIIGAIGVSGAPPGKTEKQSIDGACAREGIAAVQDVLDFAE